MIKGTIANGIKEVGHAVRKLPAALDRLASAGQGINITLRHINTTLGEIRDRMKKPKE